MHDICSAFMMRHVATTVKRSATASAAKKSMGSLLPSSTPTPALLSTYIPETQ